MPTGLQVRDTSGNLRVDLTTRVTKYVSSLTLSGTAGAATFVPVAGINASEFFMVCDTSTAPPAGPFFRIENGGLRYSWAGGKPISVHFYRF